MPPKIDLERYKRLPLGAQRQVDEDYLWLREDEKRQKARVDFGAFFEYTSPYKLEPWQHSICKLYTELITGRQRGRRIKIHKPPQHGGSIMTSQRLAPFAIGNDPNIRVRLVTYNETHSERFSKTVIGIMQEPSYQSLFPDVQIPKVAAVGEWSTSIRMSMKDSQTSFMALGLGSGWIGSGGDLVIVDDPYKTREEAFSDVIHERIKNWHNEVLVTRVNPDTNVIVMYHSWNERDYGCYLDEQGGWENWRYAAICDSENDPCGRKIGEALSPRYPLEYLEAIRDGGVYKDQKLDGIGASAFESLYQGNPKSRGGVLFKKSMFNYVNAYRKHEDGIFILGIDWAMSGEPTADRTSISLHYKRPDGTRTKVRAWFGRFNPSDTQNFIYNVCKEAVETYSEIAPVFFTIEKGIAAAEMYVHSIMAKCAEFGLREFPSTKEKSIRALPLVAQMEVGNFEILNDSNPESEGFLPPEQRWNRECENEFLSFPNAKHDDLVDSDTLTFNFGLQFGVL